VACPESWGALVLFVPARNRKLVVERHIHACHRCFGRHRGDATRLAIILTLLSAPYATKAQSSVPAEYRTRASFLATFPSFTEWPESAFSSAEAPFAVCVRGDYRFGTALAEFARAASPHGRRIDVRRARKDEELGSCHILFVSNSEAKRYAKILRILKGASVLTVGETADFLGAGGMLSFLFHDGSVQFEVNLVAANEAQLRISSRLLTLARRVVKPDLSTRRDVSKRGWTYSDREAFDPGQYPQESMSPTRQK
jgi:hypothetical protein